MMTDNSPQPTGSLALTHPENARRLGTAILVLILAILVLLSVLMKYRYLSQDSLWPDEALYLYIGRNLATDPGNLTDVFGDFFYLSPPLLVYSISLTSLVPGVPLDQAARAPVFALSVLMIALTFLIGRKLFNPAVGIIAAGLLTFCPLLNWISVRILTDGPVVFLVYLAICLLIYGKRKAFWLVAILAFLTKYSAFPILFLPLLVNMKKKVWVRVYAVMLVLLGAFVLVRPVLGHSAGWIGYFSHFFQTPNLAEMSADTSYFMGLYVLVLAFVGMVFAFNQERFSALFHWVCVFGLFRIFLPWMIFRLSRYSAPIYPALYVFAGYGVVSLVRTVSARWPRYRLLPLLFFIITAYPVIYDRTVKSATLLEQTSQTFVGYREAADFLGRQPGPLTVATASPRQIRYFESSTVVFDIEEDMPAGSLDRFIEERNIRFLVVDCWSPHLPQWFYGYDYQNSGYELVYSSGVIHIFRTPDSQTGP
jgi:4-amino-4-deoxy-L-arabinose transferase-like glycosyltransferase